MAFTVKLVFSCCALWAERHSHCVSSTAFVLILKVYIYQSDAHLIQSFKKCVLNTLHAKIIFNNLWWTVQGLHNWSVKEIVKEGKRSQKRMQLRTGKQTGSLFYLWCYGNLTLHAGKKVQEMKRRGRGLKWEGSQRFSHFFLEHTSWNVQHSHLSVIEM